jgi:cytochrome P450
MSESHAPTHTRSERAAGERACPFSQHTMPADGRPLAPSPFFADRRAEARAHELRLADGHLGLLVTDHELARTVLSDGRFSQHPIRLPLGSGHVPEPDPTEPDSRALASADLLFTDGAVHARLRKAITRRYSVKAIRGQREVVACVVQEQLDHLLAQPAPADLTEHFAEPVSTRIHAHVLGIVPEFVNDYIDAFTRDGDFRTKVSLARRAIDARRLNPGDDVISDLLASDLSDDEILGLTMALMGSGRDSVAYFIATSMVALLTHPKQLEKLRSRPELLPTAIEELLRYGSMFVTLFPRTAAEEVQIDGVAIAGGQTVCVSPVAANRDPRQFEDPDVLDVERDALGHLSFGFGVHGCVGQQLARLELREALEALITGVPTLELVDADQLRVQPYASDVPTYAAGAVLVRW